VEQPDADREDLVEAALTEIEILEVCDEELRPPGFDVGRVPT
jgi:hypothetical protein